MRFYLYNGPIPSWKLVIDQGAVTQTVLGHEHPGSGTEESPYVVAWLDNDFRDPMLLSMTRKIVITLIVSFATLVVALASSAYTGCMKELIEDLDVDREVATLGLSLFVLGFALGPVFWAPLSEVVGRQYPFILSFGAMAVLLAGCAASPNIECLIVLRFFAGAFGSAPLTNAGGVIGDMFPARQRALALSLFAAGPFMGPALGPIIGGFLGMNAGWRWVEGFLAALAGLSWLTMALFVPETYAPILLQILRKSLSRPWVLLFREPIVLLLSIYIALIYGALFMTFGAFPIVYQEGRGWNEGVGGLSFLGIMVGMILASIYTIYDNQRYLQVFDRHNGCAPPEARLPPVILASIAIPAGLFWFAWTSSPSVHWMASIAACVPFGFGVILVYLGILSYLIDSYTIFAASVLAANSVMRSGFGAIFPLFTTYMYDGLGIHWASSIPAFLTLACVPFPLVLYKKGKIIRKRCKYAAQSEAYMQTLRESANQKTTSKD
ncbi:hypothetical protein ASPVEDRAFT_54208 [Aspergillus versicolor CBS 583.65]|uniref:Major facilitator superfamily (MFS) profile domain-containing protein n=1 Tax=Aspergillus versicolor CBS 583.65 TaxID=1036611 RepID=A0A1L9PQW2_ASPVE|nr:uncharacterized protein ASPVEDRAFT_54208 [Aspergillus versicolor CBS 583.65]OJJ03917.1 hypothetical protein ASPVEDRAFT_54208 [Aspergillus versicolor CBS 583.65]